MTIILIINSIMRFFLTKFVSSVMLNLLVNLWVLVFFVISIGYELTQIMLHHILS